MKLRAIKPVYASIQPVRDLCWPWIDLWGGDEWGDPMRALHAASHIDYGFSDKDCAVLARMLLRNLISQKKWMDERGPEYELSYKENEECVRARCCELREYWRNGGPLGDSETGKISTETIKLMPDWMFVDLNKDNPC